MSAAPPAGTAAAPEDEDPATRVLRRGDLVKVLERSGPNVKERPEGLGRILKSVPISEDELSELAADADVDDKEPHPYRYDIEWVLGGRASNVERHELVYTTAEAEGMLDGGPRRKRKATTEPAKTTETTATAASTKQASKKRSKAAAGGAKGKKKASTTNSSASRKSASASSRSKAGGGKRKLQSQEDDPFLSNDATKQAGKDMYEKHRREFERMLARIEKVDQFGFFLDDVPPEHDDDDGGNAATAAAPMAIDGVVDDGSLEEKKDEEDSTPAPSPNECQNVACDANSSVLRAPYNWAVIKKRAEKGRYVADRQKQVDGKLQQLQQSYRAWLEKESLDPTSAHRLASIERPTSLVMEEENKKDGATKDVGDAAAATTGNRIDSNSEGSGYRRFKIPNPKGVDWDLFRQDVLDMCDAAVARDPDEGEDDGPGTLGYAIKKIKETLEQMHTKTGQRQMAELESADMRQKYVDALKNTENNEAAMQCDWRKEAFPERRYERLERKNVICAGLSSVDERSAVYELKTSLPDSFVGLSYTYDDMGQSEGWMKTVVDEADKSNRKRTKKKKKNVDDAGSTTEEISASNEGTDVALDAETQKEVSKALSADDGVVRAQVRTTMDILLIGVQDKVMTDARVLQHPEVRSANWDDGDQSRRNSDPGASVSGNDGLGTAVMSSNLDTSDIMQVKRREPEVAEQPVWGMDCYTRKNIAICLETDLDSAVASEFIERWLLPAINSCPVDVAHDISCAARVLEGLPPVASPPSLPANSKGKGGSGKTNAVAESAGGTSEGGSHVFLSKALKAKISAYGPPWLKDAAHRLRLAVETLGTDLFRVHPKGHGSVVLKESGLKSNTLVTHYRGEIYPPWRWGEKLDAIEKTQQRIGLRPTLPDFYNMALERPRVDPRGFGLLFVDASRKAGLGSSFSHSCDPTCEVKVVAVNGELSLAMTTLRDLECGEELTFDYHAVTESVNEYHAAICLCGHKNCRGSFLHFATADCYQQVLSRNAPIAVQFANLAKGCIKEILSKEDRRVLQSHGFGTAAFGACSFNHHRRGENEELDSLDNVPIWLKTFAADTLRYIEYERRALPIALLSNHFSQGGVPFTNANDDAAEEQAETKESSKGKGRKASSSSKSKKGKKTKSSSSSSKKVDAKKPAPFDDSLIPAEDRKAVPGCRPVSAFFFFSKQEKDNLVKSVKEQGLGHLTGLDFTQAMQKIAGAAWRDLSEEKKQIWKDRAYAEWEENGGKEKAKLEEERQCRVKAIKDAAKIERKKAEEEKRKQAEAGAKSKKKKKKVETNIETNKISFEAADAEGWAAMEQRIHQLTQTLSRVGRVIDRHREAVFESSPADGKSSSDLGPNVHSPLTMVSDEHVVGLLWSHPSGIVQSLIRHVGQAPWSNTPIFKSVVEVIVKHKLLCGCAFPSKDGRLSYSPIAGKIAPEEKLPPSKARRLVTEALLEMREAIIAGIQQMQTEATQHDKEVAKAKREVTRRKREEKKKAEEVEKGPAAHAEDATDVSAANQQDISASVEAEASHVPTPDPGQIPAADNEESATSIPSKTDTSTTASALASETAAAAVDALSALESRGRPWQEELEQKYKLESAADLLLIYAHTSTFFSLKPYKTFESTPIEVYARELGNAVPRSLVEASAGTAREATKLGAATTDNKTAPESSKTANVAMATAATAEAPSAETSSTNVNSEGDICEPDQVVTSVNVVYPGHYVLSCLLQWYLGGISLKSGLPDMNGCIVLPTMASCWSEKAGDVSHQQTKALGRSRSAKAEPLITTYDAEVRPKLVEWFEDRHKRGSPWSEDLLRYFPPPSANDDTLLMLGSPVLDLLITGNDENIDEVVDGLQYGNSDADDSDKRKKRKGKKSAAERLQSSMDEGMPAQAVANWVQCENPECMKWRKLPWHVDVDLLPEKFYCKDNKWNPGYDNCDAPEDDWDMADAPVKFNEIPLEEFKPGAKFDVIRKDRDYYTEGTVLEVDFESSVKRVYFRFRGMPDKWNEWVEAESTRIAPHQAYTRAPITKKPAAKATATTKVTKKSEKKKKGGDKKRSATPSSVASSTDGDSSSAPLQKRPKANVDFGALRAGIVGSGPSQTSSKPPPRVVEIQTNVTMPAAHHLQGGISYQQRFSQQQERPAPSDTQLQQAQLLQQMRTGQRPRDDHSLQQLLLAEEQERRLQYNRAIQQRQLQLQLQQQQYQHAVTGQRAQQSLQHGHQHFSHYGQAGLQQHHEVQSLNHSVQGFHGQDSRLQALAGTLQEERAGLELRLRALQEQRYAAAAAAARAIDRGVEASAAYNAATARQVGGPTHQQPLPPSTSAEARSSAQQPSEGSGGGTGPRQG